LSIRTTAARPMAPKQSDHCQSVNYSSYVNGKVLLISTRNLTRSDLWVSEF